MIAPVNRYKQLLALVPSGSFYATSGQTLPHRDTPYQLKVKADEPNRNYYVYLNNNLCMTVSSDANSIATIAILLVRGDNEIRLINSVTQAATTAFITTRDYATWLAALASVVEDIDIDIEQILLDSRLATVSPSMIDEVFGKMVESKNDSSYNVDTYREILEELRTAFRHYGGTDGGIDRVINAFYHISPLILDRDMAQSWRLGMDMLYPSNRTSAIDGRFASGGVLSSFAPATVTVTDVEARNENDVHTYAWTASTSSLTYTPPAGATSATFAGDPVTIASDGTYRLNGLVTQPLMSCEQTFVVSTANRYLSIEVDGRGEITVNMNVGTITATTVAGNINTALGTSPLYGPAYSTVAAVTTAAPDGSGMNRVFLQSPTGGKVVIRKAPLTNQASAASQIVFNIPQSRLEISSAIFVGDTILVYSGNSLAAGLPDTIPAEGIWAILDSRSAFATARGAYVSPTPLPGAVERVKITGIYKSVNQVTISPATLAHSANATLYLEGFDRLESITCKKSSTINVIGSGGMPAVNSTGTATYVSTHLPAGWTLTVASTGLPAAALTPTYESRFTSSDDFVFRMVPDTRLTMPVPDADKYAGFAATMYVHAYYRTQTGSAALDTFEVSYNNGATWSSLTASVVGLHNESATSPAVYKVPLTIAPSLTKMLVRFTANAGNVNNMLIQRISIVPDNLDTGLYLGHGSVPNNEMRLKSGKILLWWSSTVPSAQDMAALGLASSTQDAPGHVDKVAPDMAWLDKYQATEFSGSTPINVVGAFDDTGLNLGTITNMSLVLRTPSKMSHLVPSIVSEQTTNVVWSTVSPYTYTLPYAASQNVTNSTLFVDGVPLTQDEWQFNSATQIELINPPSSTSTYTFVYEALIQYTSSIFDMGTQYADRLWYIDSHSFILPRPETYVTSITSGLQFTSGGTATLLDRSDGDKSSASIIEDTGLSTRTIPVSQWNFIDNSTVRMDTSAIDANSIYSIRYNAATSHMVPSANLVLEYRVGASSIAVAAAPWIAGSVNMPIGNGNRYCQLRCTYTGVEDVRSVRLQSVLVKGLNMFGAGGTVPVLRP